MTLLDGYGQDGQQELCRDWSSPWLGGGVNVFDKLPKPVQPAAKTGPREVWNAPDLATVEAAIATFADNYRAKYEKAVTCLTKDQDALLTFYDVLTEHWNLGRNAWRAHLHTSNPIESVFATVRHRSIRTKGALSQDIARLMVFKLVMAAVRAWSRLKGKNQLPKVVQGVALLHGSAVEPGKAFVQFQQGVHRVGEAQLMRFRINLEESPYPEGSTPVRPQDILLA